MTTARSDEDTGRQAWNAREHVRPLEGWILLDDVAGRLGISKEAVHRLVKRGTIKPKDVRYLGEDPGRRPLLVIRERAVAGLPMTPQRRRELRLRGELPGDLQAEDEAELGDGLSGG